MWRVVLLTCADRLLRLNALRRVIHQISQLLARLKEGNPLGRNFHAGSCLRVSAHPWLTLSCAKAAKAPYLYLVALVKTIYDTVENRLNDLFGVLASHFYNFGNFFDQLGFGHI